MPWNITQFDQFGIIDDHRIKKIIGTPSIDINTVSGFAAVDSPAVDSDALLKTLPTWDDEQAALAAKGLTNTERLDLRDDGYSEAQIGLFTGKTTIDSSTLHGTTEGDPLYEAFHMYKRLVGIRTAAAADWLTRATNMAAYFTNNYVGILNAGGSESGQGDDHLYGYGLCDWYEEYGGSSALDAINNIAVFLAAHDKYTTSSVGDSFLNGNDQRRWPRYLWTIVRCSEVLTNAGHTGAAAAAVTMNGVIDRVLQMGNWNAHGFMEMGQTYTDDRIDAGVPNYAAGTRICGQFHMGIMSNALWNTWRVMTANGDTTRALLAAQRLVGLAGFFRDIPLIGSTGAATSSAGFIQLNPGYNDTLDEWVNQHGDGSPDGVYSLCAINGLVMAYKLTGSQAFLDRAWELHTNFQATTNSNGDPSGYPKPHFVDAQLSSSEGYQWLANNKGELQYTYALFENNGTPQKVSGYKPLWYTAATDKTWINMTSAVSAKEFDDSTVDIETYSTQGGTFPHTAQIRAWTGACAREDYYVIPWAGGHNSGTSNFIIEFGPFTGAAPDWNHWGIDNSKYQKPSDNLNWTSEQNSSTGYYSDGLPSSSHTYTNGVYVPDLGGGIGNMVFSPYSTSLWGGNSPSTVFSRSFSFTSATDFGGTYDAAGTWPDWPSGSVKHGGGPVFDPDTNLLWVADQNDKGLYSIDFTAGAPAWTQHSTEGTGMGAASEVVIDLDRRILLYHVNTGGSIELHVYDIDIDSTISGSTLGTHVEPTYSNTSWTGAYISMEFEPVGRGIIGYYEGATLYKLTIPSDYRVGGALNATATYTWAAITNGGGGATPPNNATEGSIQDRMNYISSIKAFAVVVNGRVANDSAMYVYKIPEDGL